MTPESQRLQLVGRERARVRAAESPDQVRARENRITRRSVWAMTAIAVACLSGTMLLALRDPSWGAMPAALVAIGGTVFALCFMLCWGLSERGALSGCIGVPLLLGLLLVDVGGMFFVGWVGADLAVRATVPAEPASVVRVQDREDTSYAIERRDSGSVVTIRLADGTVSSRPVVSDRSPDEIGSRLDVRVPSWHWVGVRSTDEGTPGWAQATAGLLALLMIGQAGATAIGFRRRFRRLVP